MIRLYFAFLMLTVAVSEPEPVGFDVLAGFDYVEGMQLPKEVTTFDEQEVKIVPLPAPRARVFFISFTDILCFPEL